MRGEGRTLWAECVFVNLGRDALRNALAAVRGGRTVECVVLTNFLAMKTGIPQAATPRDDRLPDSLPGLPRYLALSCLALIVYASLHPFSGWRDAGISPFVFLVAAWPRYWTVFDLVINVATYLPFGFFLAQSLGRRPGGLLASILAFMLGMALSFAIESIQTYLPSRVPSNIDLLCNSIGSGLGAILSLCFGRRFFRSIARRQHLLAPIPYIEYGLILTGFWLLTQLSPETLLFGAGDLRYLLDITPPLAQAPKPAAKTSKRKTES